MGQLSSAEIRRLIIQYLSMGAVKAVTVALNSTASCDESCTTRAEDVPLDHFDVVSVIDVNNDFLKADFRLIATMPLLDKLCRAMHGQNAQTDVQLLESMALEMLNMIYGYAKSNLNDNKGFRLPPAIPKLVRKPGFGAIKRSMTANLAIIPVVTPMGSFYVEVDFEFRSRPFS